MIFLLVLSIGEISYLKNALSIRKICRFAPLLLGVNISFCSFFIARTFFAVEPFRRLRTATSIFEKLLDQKTFIDLGSFFLGSNLTQKAPCRLVRRKHDAFFTL